MTTHQPVFVIMSNDFPHCVFLDKAKAEEYAAEANRQDAGRAAKDGGGMFARRVYYRVYEFVPKDVAR